SPSASPTPFPAAGIPADQLVLRSPVAVAVASDGSLYLADEEGGRIYRIKDGTAFHVAGDPRGFTADNGLAVKARLDGPRGVALGPDGSVYLTEGYRVRRIDPDGVISTVAGKYGVAGGDGDGGPAAEATLYRPSGIAVTEDGTIYVTDNTLHTVRRITPQGTIEHVVGVAEEYGADGDGGPATAAHLSAPVGVTVGPDGSIYIADSGNDRVRRVAPDGTITTAAGSGSGAATGLDGTAADQADVEEPNGVAVDPSGALYTTLVYDGTLIRVARVRNSGAVMLVPAEDR
ncbi:MAG: serine/threonine protein kinase, partial [Frankia sp.]|nr:serine/threonine protein kinase [Frankia sp.]